MPSIARILCPVDFSDQSEHAAHQAIELARQYSARLTALHVCDPFFMPVPGLPPPPDRVGAGELSDARLRTAHYFEAAGANDIPVDVLVEVGQPAVRILESAARLPADLVVMGTHGAGGFERLLLGSVAEKVLRRAACPVLTVPPRARREWKRRAARVLCAVDFSEWSLQALDYAVSIAGNAGATLLVVHVIEWPWHEPPAPRMEDLPTTQAAALLDYRRHVETSAKVRLESLLPDMLGGRAAIRVRHGKPYAEVLRLAEEEQVDLVVLGVHGRNALDIAFLGSTANHVVRSATCGVLTLRH